MISIIIPIYNAEKYLRECIDSILAQTYKNIEIILVDDGSIDNSSLICKEYALKDNRIKYYYKENSGVSDTRNFGIEKATGDYLMFIDSDDYLCDNTVLSNCHNIISRDELTMPIFNYVLKTNNNLIEANECIIDNPSKEELMAIVISGTCQNTKIPPMFRAVWGKLFSKHIINKYNIRFHKDIYLGEDSVFVMEYLDHINTVKEAVHYGIVYRNYDDSCSKKYQPKYVDQLILEFDYLNKYVKKYNTKLLNTARFNFIVNSCFLLSSNNHKYEIKGHKDEKKMIQYTKKYFKEKIDLRLLKKSRLISYILLEIYPSLLIPFTTLLVKRNERKRMRIVNAGGGRTTS